MTESWFIPIDDPRVKIRDHLKKQFMDIKVDDFIDESFSPQYDDDTRELLVLSKKQYLEKDDKWILSFSRHLFSKGYVSLINHNYNEAIENYLDSLKLHEVQRQKYIQKSDAELLRKCGKFIIDTRYAICCACACCVIEKMPAIDLHRFKIDVLSKLKTIGFPTFNDDEIIKIYISGIKYFAHKCNVFDFINIRDKITIENNRCLKDIKTYIDNRKKILRRKIFERKSIQPKIHKNYLKELSSCHLYLSKVYEMLKSKRSAMLELAYGFKYNAYMSDDIIDIEKYFDKSIKLLEDVNFRYPDDECYDECYRELLFTKARKAEYLAYRYDDLESRIKYLKSAKGYFGLLKDPRSYLASFLSLYYQMKKYIVEDGKFQLGIEVAKEIIDDKNNMNILIVKYPDIQQLNFVCKIIELFPIKTPKGAEIKKLNDLQYYITIGLEHIKPLWEIIYAYSLLRRSIGDNKDFNKFFRESISAFLQSGETREIENVAGRLFFSEPTEKVGQEFIEYLRKDEGQNLEFKASFSIDVIAFLFSGKTNYRDELEEEVLKAIVGFLNSSGGSLILGVLEKRKDLLKFKEQLDEKFNKYIVGVEREYKHDGYDGYIRRIEDILRERIDSNLPSLLKINKYSLSGHDLIHFIIPKADKWYYLDNEIFLVREHNQTISKKGADTDEYKSQNPR